MTIIEVKQNCRFIRELLKRQYLLALRIVSIQEKLKIDELRNPKKHAAGPGGGV